MRLLKFFALLVAAAGVVALAIVYAPAIYGQHTTGDFMVLRAPGASIGASVRDPEGSDKASSGVVIENVRPGSPAEQAGLKSGDVVVEYDGEHVRSARQFTRLVSETPVNRTVKAAVMRDGKRVDLQITPGERGTNDIETAVRQHLRDFDVDGLTDRLRDFNFDFEMAPPRARLGVTVQELTPQLETFFGVKHGVLVASVAEGSSAEKAGLKAGDVISAVNGGAIWTRADLTHALRDADGDTTLTVTRERKELTLKANVTGRARSTRRER